MIRSRSAFTLLEVVLGGALLVITVVPFLGFLDSLTRQTGDTRTRIVARTLARAAIERLRLEPLAELSARLATPQAGAVLIEADPVLRLPPGVESLARSVNLLRSAVLENVAPRQGVLRVRVTWTEAGQARDYTLSTLVVDDVLPVGVLP